MNILKKTLVVLAIPAVLGTAALAPAQASAHEWYHDGWHGYDRHRDFHDFGRDRHDRERFEFRRHFFHRFDRY